MAEKYSVVLSGRLREGETPDAVRVRLAELFRVRPEQLEPLFLKAPAVLRRGLDEATAAKWVAAVEKAGALCWKEPDSTETAFVPKPASPPSEEVPAAQVVPEPVAASPAPDSPVSVQPSTVSPPATTSPITPLAVPVNRAFHHYDDDEVVPYPKCPRCGRLAESVEDWFMRTGVCPQCGLIIRKYASSFAPEEKGFWSRFGAGDGAEWSPAFWRNPLWPTYLVALWYLCCVLIPIPALRRLLDANPAEAAAPTIVQMGVSGVLLAGFGVLVAVACFYCFALYTDSRRVFWTHVIWSAGICAVLGLIGGIFSLLARAIGSIARFTGIRTVLNPVRALGLTAVAFFGIMLYFSFVRLPAEKQLWEYIDGPEYSASVKGARTLAGADFPKGPRGDKYRYFKYVFVEPARSVDAEFERVLNRLLPDFSPSSFGGQHGPEVNLLVFNAITFRDELAADGLISLQMRAKLDQTAAVWEQSRAQSATRLVRGLDTRSPIAPTDLRSGRN